MGTALGMASVCLCFLLWVHKKFREALTAPEYRGACFELPYLGNFSVTGLKQSAQLEGL